jgi:hypothetical protein
MAAAGILVLATKHPPNYFSRPIVENGKKISDNKTKPTQLEKSVELLPKPRNNDNVRQMKLDKLKKLPMPKR